ncbi:type ISP restriction/modification enzyme, partial [Staphylococcus sp. GDX8P80P]
NQMKFKDNKQTIIFNEDIKIKKIPVKAYDYVVNGKSAIDWIVDQYKIKMNKSSNLIDNPNEYSEDPKYIFNLLLSVITVSIESVRCIEELPVLKIIVDENVN